METGNHTSRLKAKLKSWGAELTGIGLTKDDRSELQSHMEDSLEELLADGLNEEEAWTVAIQRMGSTQDIGEEFKKVQEGRIPLFNRILYWVLLFFLIIQAGSIARDLVLYFLRIGQVPFFSLFCLLILGVTIGRITGKRQILRGYTKLGLAVIAVPLILMSLLFGSLAYFDGPQCYNSNQVFRDNSPRSEIYVDELVKHFTTSGSNNLYYRFAYYYVKDGRDYIVLKAIGKGFCGFFSLDVTNSKRLDNLIKVKGMGYSGSLWRGLKFDVVRDGSRNKFVFRNVEDIVD